MIKDVLWSDVSVDKYMKHEMIRKMQNHKIRKYIDLVGLHYDLENPLEMTLEDYGKYIPHLAALAELPSIAEKVTKEVEINGERFKRLTDVKDITGGAFISFAVKSKDNNLAEMLAVLYSHEKWDFKQRMMWIRKHETIDRCYPYIGFFLLCMKESQVHFQKSLPLERKQRRQTPIL